MGGILNYSRAFWDQTDFPRTFDDSHENGFGTGKIKVRWKFSAKLLPIVGLVNVSRGFIWGSTAFDQNS